MAESAGPNRVGEPGATGRGRRRRWIVGWSLPGFLALGVFALMAAVQSSQIAVSDRWTLITFPLTLVGIMSWGFAPSAR